jgi:cytochrome P450
MFGHDTGAAALAWAFEHLHRAPEPLRRATDEARGLAADGRAPDAESSPYLHACLCESMRLAPVVVHLTRVATRDVEIAGEKLASGACVLPSAYVAQHNPEVFPEPQRFEPERFLRRSSYPHAYFPFGLGARSCIGEPLVMRQMLQILSIALAETRLERVREGAARPVRKLALIVPEGGTRMRRIA